MSNKESRAEIHSSPNLRDVPTLTKMSISFQNPGLLSGSITFLTTTSTSKGLMSRRGSVKMSNSPRNMRHKATNRPGICEKKPKEKENTRREKVWKVLFHQVVLLKDELGFFGKRSLQLDKFSFSVCTLMLVCQNNY